MQTAELKVVTRDIGHRGTNRKLRREGQVPAHIYGPGSDNGSCYFAERELRVAFDNDFNAARIIQLKSEDSGLNGKKVILKSVERDPKSWRLVHADLYELSMEKPIKVAVPLKLIGTPEGVKLGGGILAVERRTVEVKALPNDLPDSVELNIESLQIGDNVHVRDLKVADNVTILDLGDYTVASVAQPQEEEEAPVVAVAEGAEGAAAEGAEGAAPAEGAEGADKKAPAAGDKKPEGEKK